MNAYCCINTLITSGIPGKYIKFVKPPCKVKPSRDIFNNENISSAMEILLDLLGVETYQDYELQEWHVVHEQVTIAQFAKINRIIRLTVISLFCYSEKHVNFKTFLAINKAGIVFDGEVVIDYKFRTNDPNIYACGTLTKYSRRFYADDFAPKYYDQCEIGERLGMQIRAEYCDETVTHKKCKNINLDCRDKQHTPTYNNPLICHCILPGQINYLYITKPGKPIPDESMKSGKVRNKIMTN